MDSEATAEARRDTPERIVLTSPTDTIELKQLVHDDASHYLGLVSYDRAHLSQFGDDTAEKYKTIEDVEKSIDSPDPTVEQYRFGVWDQGKMVGYTKLTYNKEGDLESGYWVGAEHTGNAYASRAQPIVLGYAFDVLEADRVIAKVAVGNDASRKTLETSGYIYLGQQGDQWVYGITKDSFETLRSSNGN